MGRALPPFGAVQRSEISDKEKISEKEKIESVGADEGELLGIAIGQAMLVINGNYSKKYLAYSADVKVKEKLIGADGDELIVTFKNSQLGGAPEKYFKLLETMTFECLSEVSAYDAIWAFVKGPTICECLSSAMAALFLGIANFLGKEKFDKKFGGFVIPGAFYAQQNEKKHPLSKNLITVSAKEARAGDWTIIPNLPSYKEECGGPAAQFNVVCVGKTKEGEPLWSGLGVSIGKEGQLFGTQAEILEFLVDEYIKDYRGKKTLDREKIRKEFDKSKTAGKVTSVKRLNWSAV